MGAGEEIGAGGRRDYAVMKVERAMAALAELAPGSHVLEVGCGGGATTRAMVRARPDLVEFMLAISAAQPFAQREHPGAASHLSWPR